VRTAFIKQLIAEARMDRSVFLIVGDLGFSVVEPFAEEFPDRFLNAGVAEQNMTGVASGLAKEGFKVFTYSIGNFPTLRCIEQIRNDVCYHEANVKIVAVGGGYAYGPLGFSHHATEELGMLRTIPNLAICVPGDPVEAECATSLLVRTPGPCYMRLGKAGERVVHTDAISLEWGKMLTVREGKKTAVLTHGSMLKTAFDFIAQKTLNWGLYSVPFIRPFDAAALKHISSKYDTIVTIEEHQRSGGLGSVILEQLNDLKERWPDDHYANVRRIAIPDTFIDVAGTQEYLRSKAGLVLNV
jgi:transketolase